MVSIKTRLTVSDNSGALTTECIKTYRFSKRNDARVGEYILVTVKRAATKRRVKKSQIHRLLVTQEKRPLLRRDGTILTLDQTSGVLLKDYLPLGTRVSKLIPIEVRAYGYLKVISMAPSIM